MWKSTVLMALKIYIRSKGTTMLSVTVKLFQKIMTFLSSTSRIDGSAIRAVVPTDVALKGLPRFAAATACAATKRARSNVAS